MKYPAYDPEYGLQAAKQPSRSEAQAYISTIARTPVGSLGVDEAARRATRLHGVVLPPLVMAEVGAICLDF